MSDLERNLRDLLAQRAGAGAPSPGDWQDLTLRMARRNRRAKRMLAVGLVAALIIGPLAGFAVANTIDDGEPGGEVTAVGPGDSSAVRTGGAGASASLGIAGYPPLGDQLDKLLHRTTDDGITIRAFTSQIDTGACERDACPPADCLPNATVQGQLSTDDAVGFAGGVRFGGKAENLRVTGGGIFGANGEGSPARWTLAQTGDGVAKVKVSYEGGGSDEMEPVDGIVLLAARADTAKSGGTVEALDESGSVLEHVDVNEIDGSIYASGIAWDATAILRTEQSVAIGGSVSSSSASGGTDTATTTTPTTLSPNAVPPPDVRVVAPSTEPGAIPGLSIPSRCLPVPPTLPEPGEHQPSDPAAAKAEIEAAFTTAYNGGLGNNEEKRAVVQDSESLQGVMDEIRNGPYAPQVQDATAHVSEIVFPSPTEAAVRYDINVKDYSNFTDRIGRALLIDGRWKVARDTVCADISLSGSLCPPK